MSFENFKFTKSEAESNPEEIKTALSEEMKKTAVEEYLKKREDLENQNQGEYTSADRDLVTKWERELSTTLTEMGFSDDIESAIAEVRSEKVDVDESEQEYPVRRVM